MNEGSFTRSQLIKPLHGFKWELEPMKKYMLSLLGIIVAMAFIASCQQEGTTVTEEPAKGPTAYMNRPAQSPTR